MSVPVKKVGPCQSMRKPTSMKALETLGRVRLSEHFFMREMLYSEIANFHGILVGPPSSRDRLSRGGSGRIMR